MKKKYLLILMIFSIQILISQLIYSQTKDNPAKFRVKVVVTGADNGLPLKGTRIILASMESFWDMNVQITDENGTAILNATDGGKYKLIVYNAYYKKVDREIEIKKYGDQTEFDESIAMERSYYDKDIGKPDKRVDITVKGKDHDGNIKLLKGAVILCPQGQLIADDNGYAEFEHGYPQAALLSFTIMAEGYVSKEEAVLVGTKPAMIYEPDRLEVILDMKPLPAVQLKILVLDRKTDKAVDSASVHIKFKTPVKVNNQVKNYWSSEISNSYGIASFTDSNERAIPVDLVNSNEFAVEVTKKNYKETWSDISKDLLVPSTEPRVFTVWLTPIEKVFKGPGWKLVSVTVNPEKITRDYITVTKNKISAKVKNSTLEMTVTDAPEFVPDNQPQPQKMEFTTSYSGQDDNISISIDFYSVGFVIDHTDNDGSLASGRINNNSFYKESNKGTFTIKSGNWMEAKISPAVYINGLRVTIFEAKYERVQ